MPEIYDERWIDEIARVSDEQAAQTTRRLTKEEGIFAGISSGAVMFAALEKVKTLDKGNMVVLLADTGERYLSTGLLTDKK